MDDICGIKHDYNFAYGSNMFPPRLLNRIGKYHCGLQAIASGYEFTYNKEGVDNTAKANLKSSTAGQVYGVCFEIDKEDFSKLDQYEKGYERCDIELQINGKKETARTYMSSCIGQNNLPSTEYKNLILQGARYWGLDKKYVADYLK